MKGLDALRAHGKVLELSLERGEEEQLDAMTSGKGDVTAQRDCGDPRRTATTSSLDPAVSRYF